LSIKRGVDRALFRYDIRSMLKVSRRKPDFRSFAGIAASVAIVCLLLDGGSARPAPLILAYAVAAAASFIGSIPPSRPARGEVLRLESFGVTVREREFVLEFLGGKSMKEISIENRLSFSTVRNAFSSVYEKLGISGSGELTVLGLLNRLE
jgi:DNA-binding CsgD family transcriptional regulator